MVKVLEQATHIACIWRLGLLCTLDSAQVLIQVLPEDKDEEIMVVFFVREGLTQ